MHRYFFDDFEAGVLDPNYEWFDQENPDTWQIVDGRLMIWASSGQDLWGGLPRKRGAPLMLYPAPSGDYEVRCVVDAGWASGCQYINTQVGLFVFQNLQNWLFYGFTYHMGVPCPVPDGDGLIVTSVLGDVPHIDEYLPFAADSATLRIVRSSHWWSFYYKMDHSWLGITKLWAPLGTRHKVGMGVKSFQEGGTAEQGHFDDFEILVP